MVVVVACWIALSRMDQGSRRWFGLLGAVTVLSGALLAVVIAREVTLPGTPLAETESDDTIVCRCERITRKEIVDYIRTSGTKDFNALKAAIRVGIGPCGGKTCNDLVMRIFYQELGRDAEVQKHIERPLFQEVPLKAFLSG